MAVPAPGAPRPPAPQYSHREVLGMLSGALLGLLLAALDQTIVVTALPSIAADFNGLEHLAWIVTAYLLTSTASTPIYGKLSDLYGRRRLIQIAIVLFVAASAFCALAQGMGQLIAARALQGIGGGGLISLSQAIIADIIAPRERGRYQVYMSGVWGVASVGGPVVGGLFVQYLTWRWVFWINLPIGLLGLALAHRALKRLPVRRVPARIDYLGAAILTPAVVALLLVFSWGGVEFSWLSPEILGLAAAGLLMVGLFALQEMRAPEPLLPPRLFRNPVILVGNIIGFVVSAGMFGATVLLPTFLQLVLGMSPGNTGLLLIPLMGGTVLGAYPTGQWMRHSGRYKKAPLITLSLAVLSFGLLATTGSSTPPLLVAFYILLLGVGVGGAMPATLVAVQNAAEMRDTGTATSSVTFFRSLGGSFGAAILWSILLATVEGQVAAMGVAGTGLPRDLLRGGTLGLSPAARDILAQSFDWAFAGGAAMMVAAVLGTLAWKEIPLRESLTRSEPPIEF
ncbi:MAG TPA: MDR family MFS transporter [Stellaceae bacterium]|nr:MDR family MFS transporter [Stellaceae bacterium]